MRQLFRLLTLAVLTLAIAVSCRSGHSSTIPEWDVGSAQLTTIARSPNEQQPFVWWEAEQPVETNFPPSDRHPFAPANPTEAALLSNEQWIGVEGKRSQVLFADYDVTVPETGEYYFYVRKFWRHGPFRWQWNDQPWQAVSQEVSLLDSVPLRQFVEANWVSLGRVTLDQGSHRFKIELTEKDGAAAFDCFLLTRSPVPPQGLLRPDQRYTATIPDGFLFDPEPDPIRASPIDLRRLNEPTAGSQGFIQVKGEEFVHGDTGKPVKFWAVNVGGSVLTMDRTSMQTMARFLAKQGVNMVRVHTAFWQDDDFKTVSPEKLNGLFALVAELKRQGIYTALSIYFPVWRELTAADGFEGYSQQRPFALLFFNPQFQQLYLNWWKTILTTPNPETGLALRDDPAIAAVELVNEDSYFFWTFTPYTNIPAEQMRLLERQFGDWLTQKYGSVATAIAKWATPEPLRGDEPGAGRAGFLPLYELVAQRQSPRAQDTAAFLAASQQQFFTTAIAHLRDTLQFRGLIYASNWITADPQILGPLDKYTNTVGDFMDRHGYFGGPHEGDNAAFSMQPGHVYEDRSALLFQPTQPQQDFNFDLPIMDLRYNGKPSTITEVNWVPPNRFRADFPVLAATYGALQGTDGFFFFAAYSPRWDTKLSKFSIATPVIMGQFPAAALIYRQGMIQPGQTAIAISLNTEEILTLQGAPVSAPQNLDEFRARDIPAGQSLQSDRADSIDPLAFLVGKVNLTFGEQASAQQLNLSEYINRDAKLVRSSTGQLTWNYGSGLVTINAPQAQGATGFLQRAGTLTLEDLKIQAGIDYGSILLVALDEKPLAASRRMLLQVMSEDQNVGWQTTGTPRKTIQSTGEAAIAVRNLAGQVSVLRSDAASLKVTALDANGYPVKAVGTAANLTLQPQTFYYLIEKS